MALSTARIDRVRGRPPLLAAGIISLIHSHSSSVRSLGYIFSLIYPFYTTHEDFSDRLLGVILHENAQPPKQEDDPMWQQEFTWFFALFHREFRQGVLSLIFLDGLHPARQTR